MAITLGATQGAMVGEKSDCRAPVKLRWALFWPIWARLARICVIKDADPGRGGTAITLNFKSENFANFAKNGGWVDQFLQNQRFCKPSKMAAVKGLQGVLGKI